MGHTTTPRLPTIEVNGGLTVLRHPRHGTYRVWTYEVERILAGWDREQILERYRANVTTPDEFIGTLVAAVIVAEVTGHAFPH